jgi:hypothetical protein
MRSSTAPLFAWVVAGRVPDVSDPDTGWTPDPTGGAEAAALDENAEATMAALDEARLRLASVPASVVVANHAVGLYELAAIHLSSPEPDLAAAALAIDAFGAVLESCSGRLGEDEATLTQALTTIRMVYVTHTSS